jgi:5-methylcytosine-specific restriction endonuclease McrA
MTTVAGRDGGVRNDVVALAEKVLALLGEGRYTATYKYAVLLALMDLCLEKTQADGAAPEMVTTRELAERVVAIYWPHCVPYHATSSGGVLRQSLGGRSSQAEIVSLIVAYRDAAAPFASTTPPRVRAGVDPRYRKLIHDVEWKLIEMPLPRLQTFGGRDDPFLYRIAWGRDVKEREVRAYQQGKGGAFDNRLLLLPGVGDALVTLNGLLRPLIHREWAGMVARMNGMEEARLEMFLFGQARINLAPVRGALQELQQGRCFYCDDALGRGSRAPHVDHFIPWARYPNNAIENLVVAHDRCNAGKKDFLAASDHVARWRERISGAATDELKALAASLGWESAGDRSVAVARGIYFRLPGDMPLWVRGAEFAADDVRRVRELLGGG